MKYYIQYKTIGTNNLPATWQCPYSVSSESEAKAKFQQTHPSDKYKILNVYKK
jgi:hypothetical protein